MAHSPALARFLESTKVDSKRWRAGKGYDLDAVEEMTDGERVDVIRLMCDREVITWREVEVLIVLDPALAEKALDRAEGNEAQEEVAPTRSAKHKKKAEPKRTPAFKRFMAGMEKNIGHWPEGVAYDIAAVVEMNDAERAEIVQLLTHRGEMTWREVEVLAAIDSPEARTAVDAASNHYTSTATRLAAAAAMHAAGRLADFDEFLAKQIRSLSRIADGSARALELAQKHPSETVKQALLWAGWNQTECAPGCAAMLCVLAGKAKDASDPALQPMLEKLGVHNSYFERKRGFEELCKRVGLTLSSIS